MSRRLTLILVLTFALALLLTGQPAPLAAAPPAQSSQQPPPPPPGSTSTPNPTATNTPTQTAVPVGTPTATTGPVTCPPVGLGGNYVWMVKDTQPDSPPQQYFPQGTVTVYARLCYVAQDGQPLDYVIEIYDDTVMTPLYRRAGRYPGVGYYTHPEAIDIPVLLPTARQPFRTRIIFPSLSPGAWGGDWVWAVGSSVSLDKSEYVGISEPARVTVLDPLVEDDQISVDVMSTRPDGSLISSMRLVLARTGPTGNRFEGSLTFRQNSGGMGQLLVEDGATITVRYTRPTPPIVATAVWRLPPTPSPTPTTTTTTTVTPTPSRTASPTISPTPTATLPPTRTQTPTITPTWTPGPSSTPTATPTVTLTPSLTATASPTAVPTWTPQAGTRSIVAQEGQTGYFSALQGRSVPNNLWAGVWSNGLNIHHGVAQFNLSDLPPGALITQASVSLTGRLNYLNASYPVSWTLGLLPDKFGGYEESQPLSSATYNDVHAATVTLATPAYDSRELGVGLGNTFALTAEQLAALNARRATTGRVTFRIDGPPGGPDNLFVWCGNAPIVNGAQNCTGASRPTLSLAFVVPAATFTPTTSPTPTATGTATPTPSPTGTATPSPTRTVTPSVTFTVTPGPTRTAGTRACRAAGP